MKRDRSHLLIGVGLIVVAVAVWCSPAFRMMPVTATADTQLHNGWVDQLLAGETTPGAILTGDVPNYYPWLFHSLSALTTMITPGGSPSHALAPLQLVQVAGAVLALFALGRALTRKVITGVGTALLGALSGGFGFVLLSGFDVVTDPRAGGGAAALRYHGDLLATRSYNVGLHNIAPAFPRDLAFALLMTFVLVLALRIRLSGRWIDVVAGVSLGLIGMTGGETFFVAFLLAILVIVFDSKPRTATAARMLLPALAIYSIWFVPIVINYLRLDGFVSITHIIPVALPATAILVSWGLVTPLALGWLTRGLRKVRVDRVARLGVLFVIASGTLLALSTYIPELLGDAFDTLGRHHRYWPIFYLSMAVIGGLGFTKVVEFALRRSNALAAIVISLSMAIALASPVVASVALPNIVNRHPEITEAMIGADDSELHQLRAAGPGCVVAAHQDIARIVFSYTGYRLVLWTGTWFGPNRARIRWAGIYDHITPEADRIRDNKKLVSGDPSSTRWAEAADRYGVDLVVTDDGEIITIDECGDG